MGFGVERTFEQEGRPVLVALKAGGGKLHSEPVDAPWGARCFRLTDPDGFKLAVLKSLA